MRKFNKVVRNYLIMDKDKAREIANEDLNKRGAHHCKIIYIDQKLPEDGYWNIIFRCPSSDKSGNVHVFHIYLIEDSSGRINYNSTRVEILMPYYFH